MLKVIKQNLQPPPRLCINKSIKRGVLNPENLNTNDTIRLSKKISFGAEYPSGNYNYEEIEDATWSIEDGNENWRDVLYDKFYKREKERNDMVEGRYRDDSKITIDQSNPIARVFLAAGSFGLTEVLNTLEYFDRKNKARNYVNRIAILRADMENQKLNEKIKEIEKIEEEASKKIKITKQISAIKETQLKPKLLDLIQRDKEKKSTNIPNCIMLAGKDEEINKYFIKWTKENANCRVVTTDYSESIMKHLKDAKNNFENTQNHTLINIEGFDRLLNPTITSDEKIESIKSILSSASDTYHTTIIFSTKNANELDKIAIQPHRITSIDTTLN